MRKVLLLLLFFSSIASAQVRVILDDDCTDDVDCGVNFATLHQLANQGELTILATMANSGNSLAAPAMKVYNTYYGRAATPVGVNKSSGPPCTSDPGCSSSLWLAGLIAQFDPGDTAGNYPDCVSLYRSILAKQRDASVVIVETGFMTCLSGLLASPPDTFSSLTGAALAKAKVRQLVVMGGAFPSGGEYNFTNAPTETASVLSTWTVPHGFSPVWFVSFAGGASVQSGPSRSSNSAVNPVLKAFELAGTNQRGSWDSQAILNAARGLAYKGIPYWGDSGDGTNRIDPVSGKNSWSATTQSGHHYLINSMSSEGFSRVLDGYQHHGFAGAEPRLH